MAISQTIEKNGSSTVAGAVCPGLPVVYGLVNVPSSFAACSRKWVPTNGVVVGGDTGPTVSIQWNDTPGAKAKLVCQFSSCGNSNSGTETAPFEELILSVKDQAWGSYGSSVSIDLCTKAQVNLVVPHMYVQGTGGINQPPQKEVAYSWTLPSGWREVGTGSTGNFVRFINAIAIEPIGCSVPGSVTVKGIISVPPIACGSAAPSATASILLNSANPIVTVGPTIGYSGARACDTSPVTFTPTINLSLGCVTNFTWTYPSGWSGATSSTGAISLTPNGTGAVAGTVQVTANTTCGSTFSGTYNVVLIQPVISGSNPVCSNGNFVLQNTAANPSAIWSSSNANGLNINQSSGAFTINSNFKGNVTISASACGISASPKVFTVGTPSPPVDILQGSGTIAIGATVPFTILDPNNFSSTVSTSYVWDVSGGYFNPLQGSEAYVTITDNYLVLYASTSNACGLGGTISRSFSTENGGCPPGEICMARVFPNPADNSTKVIIKKSIKGADAELSLLNRDLVKVLHLKTKEEEIVIPTSNLPDGIYYLNVLQGKEKVQRQVVVKH